MSETDRTSAAHGGSVLGALGRQLGVLFVLASLGGQVLSAFARATAVSTDDHGVPVAAVALATIVAAGGATTWLEAGGYERLGADRDRGGEFALLAMLGMPFTFLPTAGALSLAVGDSQLLLATYYAACTVLAAWFSLYGGRDRLGLDAAVFDAGALYGVAVAFGGAILAELLPWRGALAARGSSVLATDATLVVAALCAQCVVLAVARRRT